MKIKNETEAKEVWKRIEAKYAGLVPETSAYLRAAYSKKITSDDFKKELSNEDLESVKSLQRWWKKRRNEDTLVSVRSKGNYPKDKEPKGNYPDGLHHLVNQQKIKRSLNRKKLRSLANAVHFGDWDDSIFQDQTIPQLAMSLYASSQITQQQIYSILERHQIKKSLQIKKTYPILDKNNQFTPDAKHYLTRFFKYRWHLKTLSEEQIEDFRLLISTLPISERVFYTTDLGSVERYSLGNRLVALDSVYMQDNELIHLTSGARDALGIARFGENEYVRPMLRLGMQTVHDIEHGVRKQARYTAIAYPNTKAYADELHGWQNVTAFEATSHDFYHMNIMSTIPKNLLRGLWRLVDITRKNTGMKMSKEIWDWIDAEYNLTFHNHRHLNTDNLNEKQTTELFCNILRYATSGKTGRGGALVKRQNAFFPHNRWSPNPLGIIAYLDMLKNPDKWSEMGINPDYLISPFKQHLAAIRDIYPQIENNSFKIQMVKCLMRLTMGSQVKYGTLDLVDEFTTEIEQKISIKKIKKAEETSQNPANTIQFTYDGTEISATKIYNDLKKLKYQKEPLNFKKAFAEWLKENPITAGFMCIPAFTIPLFIYALIQVQNQLNKNKQTDNSETSNKTPEGYSSLTTDQDDIDPTKSNSPNP